MHRASAHAAGADAALDRRLVDLRDRLPLCRDGLHHGGRAGGRSAPRAARPSRARRHPDHRQGDAGDARQRRFPARPDARRRGRARRSSDYVAWTLDATRALGVKVINAGGAAAFKDNVRAASRSTTSCRPTASPRAQIVKRCSTRCTTLGVPHPLHVHCNNLGIAGNVETALATIAAAEGLPLHLAHLQFYGYGTEGKRGFSSAAARLAEPVNARQERHHRRRPGDVRPDRHDLVRRAAPVRRARIGPAAANG